MPSLPRINLFSQRPSSTGVSPVPLASAPPTITPSSQAGVAAPRTPPSPEDVPLTVTLKRESVITLQNLSVRMGVSIPTVITEATALLKIVSGRRIVLKDKQQTVEIDRYEKLPAQVEFATQGKT